MQGQGNQGFQSIQPPSASSVFSATPNYGRQNVASPTSFGASPPVGSPHMQAGSYPNQPMGQMQGQQNFQAFSPPQQQGSSFNLSSFSQQQQMPPQQMQQPPMLGRSNTTPIGMQPGMQSSMPAQQPYQGMRKASLPPQQGSTTASSANRYAQTGLFKVQPNSSSPSNVPAAGGQSAFQGSQQSGGSTFQGGSNVYQQTASPQIGSFQGSSSQQGGQMPQQSGNFQGSGGFQSNTPVSGGMGGQQMAGGFQASNPTSSFQAGSSMNQQQMSGFQGVASSQPNPPLSGGTGQMGGHQQNAPVRNAAGPQFGSFQGSQAMGGVSQPAAPVSGGTGGFQQGQPGSFNQGNQGMVSQPSQPAAPVSGGTGGFQQGQPGSFNQGNQGMVSQPSQPTAPVSGGAGSQQVGRAQPNAPVSGGTTQPPAAAAAAPTAANPLVQAVVEDPAKMQAIAQSTNADVVALRNLLESDKKKAATLLEEKKAGVEKWKKMCAELGEVKATLLTKLEAARVENAQLKEEYSTLCSSNKTVEDELTSIVMDEMRKEHLAALAMLRDAADEGDRMARPEHIGNVSHLIEGALGQLLSASESGSSVTVELMDLQRRMRAYLAFVRGVAFNTDDLELAARVTEAGERAAASELFLAALANPTPENLQALAAAIRAGVADVDAVCKLLAEKEVKEEAQEDEKLQDVAEQQLRAAALAIEQAAQQIAAIRAKPKPQDFGMGALEVSEALLSGTEELALITGRLVMHATLAQKERKAKESGTEEGEEARQLYRENQTWVNGLISAAQSAAFRITLLVQIANKVVQKEQSWEYMIAGSEEVQMAGVQLVTAARAKLDNYSKNRSNLESTQSELSVAVKKLIQVANQFYEEIEPAQASTHDLSSTKAHLAVHQHKSDVEALEVQLKREQMQLLELLTQASGGRTDDTLRSAAPVSEPVNRGVTQQTIHALPAGSVSPRSNPFQTNDADTKTSPRIRPSYFGGAVSGGGDAAPAGAVPSAAMFEPAKKGPPSKAVPIKGARGRGPSPKTAPAATGVSPKSAPAAPVKMSASPQPAVKRGVSPPPAKMGASPPPAKMSSSLPPSKMSHAPPPSKFNPFGAIGAKGPAPRGAGPKKVPAKAGARPMPPPPGKNANVGRPVPPPPK